MLYFALVLALGSLVIIVYAAKTRKWFFGTQYQRYLQTTQEKVQEALQKSLGAAATEAHALTADGLTQKLWVSYRLGEDTRAYIADFQKKLMGMSYGRKIQVVDTEGRILLSTVDLEAETKKISASYLKVLRDHFAIHQRRPHVLFQNNQQDFIICEKYPRDAAAEEIIGYILVYYNTSRILEPFSGSDLRLAGSKNNRIFLTSKQYTPEQVNALLNRLDSFPAGQKTQDDFLIRFRINGVVAAYDIHSKPYRPWAAIFMVLINLALLGLVIYVLFSYHFYDRAEKYVTDRYRQNGELDEDDFAPIPMARTSTDNLAYAAPQSEEIRSLVRDIERGKTYSGSNGQQGIEDMIMQSDTDFTSMPGMLSDNDQPEFTSSSRLEDELPDFSDELDMGSQMPEKAEFDTSGGDFSTDLSLENDFSSMEASEGSDFTQDQDISLEDIDLGENFAVMDTDSNEAGEGELDSFTDSRDVWDSKAPEENDAMLPDWQTDQNGIGDLEQQFDRVFEEKLGNSSARSADMAGISAAGFEAQEQTEIQMFEPPLEKDELEVAAQTYEELNLPQGGEVEGLEQAYTAGPEKPEQTDTETALFAEQDRILQGIDEDAFQSMDNAPSEEDDLDLPDISIDETELDLDLSGLEEIGSENSTDATDFPQEISLEDLDNAALSDKNIDFDLDLELPQEEGGLDLEPEESLEAISGENSSQSHQILTGEDILQETMTAPQPEIVQTDLDIPLELNEDMLQEITDLDNEAESLPLDNNVIAFEEELASMAEPDFDEEGLNERAVIADAPFEPETQTASLLEQELDLPDLESLQDIMDTDQEKLLQEIPDNTDEDFLSEVTLPEEEAENSGVLDIDTLVASVPEVGSQPEEDEEIALSMDELSNLDIQEEEVPVEQPGLDLDIDELVSSVPVVGEDLEDESIALDPDELNNLESGLELEDLDTPGSGITAADEMSPEEALPADETVNDLDIDGLMSSVPEIEDIVDESEDISLSMDDLSNLDIEEIDNSSEIIPEEMQPVSSSVQEDKADFDFDDVFGAPPVKLSSITSVEEYAQVAQDLARNSLKMSKVAVYKKQGAQFISILNDGFESDIILDESDPLLQKYINRHKSIDIRGDLENTRYLKERFSAQDLKDLEELLIVPVVHGEDINGLALFGRMKRETEPTNFQKSELHNLGFLQEN